jgi:hypothetical protein
MHFGPAPVAGRGVLKFDAFRHDGILTVRLETYNESGDVGDRSNPDQRRLPENAAAVA